MSGEVDKNTAYAPYQTSIAASAPDGSNDNIGKIKKARGRRVASVNDIVTVQGIETGMFLLR
jgi:hypothetical protein